MSRLRRRSGDRSLLRRPVLRQPRLPPTRSSSGVAVASAASSSRRTRNAIVVETGPGRVTLSMALVEELVEGRSALEAYRERAEALEPGDVEGWAALARWAAERDMLTQSRETWQRVLGDRSLSPGGQRRPRAGRGGRHLDGPGRGLPRSRFRLVRGTLGHAARARGPGARACGRRSLGGARPARPGCGCGRPRRAPGGGGRGPGGRIRGTASRRRHPLGLGRGRMGLGRGRMGLEWGRRPAGCPVGRPHTRASGRQE